MPTTQSQIALLEDQIEQLRHRSLLELKIKLGEARHLVASLQTAIEEVERELAAVGHAPVARKPRQPRGNLSIESIAAAIRRGATNYTQVAKVLGCATLTVARKVAAEGTAAGITSRGQKGSFRLEVTQ